MRKARGERESWKFGELQRWEGERVVRRKEGKGTYAIKAVTTPANPNHKAGPYFASGPRDWLYRFRAVTQSMSAKTWARSEVTVPRICMISFSDLTRARP